MSYDPIYQREYYKIHRMRLQAYNRERLRALRSFVPREEAPQRVGYYINGRVYKQIKRAVGHTPEWWELEYFQEEWR